MSEGNSSSAKKDEGKKEIKEIKESDSKKRKQIPKDAEVKYVSIDVGVCNIGYWRGTINNRGVHNTEEWDVLAVASGKSRIQDIVKGMSKKLNELFPIGSSLLSTIDAVLIEQQPLLNRTTQILSFAIQMFFINRIPKCKVVFVSPKNKLEYATQLGVNLNKKDFAKVHTANKEIATKGIRILLKKRPEELAIFDSYDKQDDLADALLQALAYHQRRSITGSGGDSDKPKRKRKRVAPPKLETQPVLDEKPI